jgi:hypothetical protein
MLEAWLNTGMAAPHIMASTTITLPEPDAVSSLIVGIGFLGMIGRRRARRCDRSTSRAEPSRACWRILAKEEIALALLAGGWRLRRPAKRADSTPPARRTGSDRPDFRDAPDLEFRYVPSAPNEGQGSFVPGPASGPD